jgi:hypothetical protein
LYHHLYQLISFPHIIIYSLPGLLAVRILAAQDRRLLERMDQYLIKQEEEVLRKASKLETKGYKAYLAGQL